jgi:filamentous hemagglutinin family protein
MITATHKTMTALTLSFFVAQMAVLPIVFANPTEPSVVAGEATVSGLGTSRLTIQQASQAAIINWQQFNIAPNEITQFIQPNVHAIALNRIFDQNPSQIFGSLQANGTVILLNPNGIMFGPNAQVNVGGVIASSLNLSNANFLAGHYLFPGTGIEGMVKNMGAINASHDGVYLLAPNVENSGVITSPGGNIVLAAGSKAYLSNRPDGRGFLAELSNPLGQAVNLKDLISDGGNITLAGRVVNQEGLVQANSVRERNGKIELYAGESLTLRAGSQTRAQGGMDGISDGGTILAIADKSKGRATFDQGAVLDVSGGVQGGHGGFVELSGYQVKLGGRFLGGVRAGYTGGRLLIDPVDVDLSGLSASGLSTITFTSPDDLRVTGMFDMDALAPPSGGEGTLQFIAGRDLLFNEVFLFNHPEDLGSSKWNYTGTAGNDIVFTGSNLWTGRGGRIDFQAGRDLKLEQGGFHSTLYTVGGGDIRLAAGRDLIVPSAFDAGTFQFMSGIRVGGPGNLTLTAGRHLLGGSIDGVKAGPGFLLNDGTATLSAGTVDPVTNQATTVGTIGSSDAYANITLGKGQVTMSATGDIFLGLIQDKGLAEGQAAVTAHPDNTVSAISKSGDIHLKPVSARGDGLDAIRVFYPASFKAHAEQGSVFIEKSLTFWPSRTGTIDVFAKNDITGQVAFRKERNGINYVPVFVGYGGLLPGEWKVVALADIAKDPVLAFWASRKAPEYAKPLMPTVDTHPQLFPEVLVPDSVLTVNLPPGDPQKLVGLSSVGDVQRAMATPAANVPAHQAVPVKFQTETGDISKLQFQLNSPTLKKDVTINAGRDLREFTVSIALPEGTTSLVRAGNNIDMTRPSAAAGAPSGIAFNGTGTGRVSAGNTLDLADSQGITYRFEKFPTGDKNKGGLLDIEVGGDLAMTKSRIASFNGASVSIHGLGVDPLVDVTGAPAVVGGNPQAVVGSTRVRADGKTVLIVNGEEVIYNGRSVVMDQTAPLGGTESVKVHVGLVEQSGKLLLTNGKLIEPLRHKGKPVVLNGELVLIGDGKIFLADAQSVQVVMPTGGNVDVGGNVIGSTQESGILTVRGGGIDIKSTGDVNVNKSRVSTFGGGDINVTSTKGNINAGSGGKNEVVRFIIEELKFNPDGTPVIGPDGKQAKEFLVFLIPGSGISTFHPPPRVVNGTVVEAGDPFPLVFPEFNTPEILAINREIEKASFFGRSTTTLLSRKKQLEDARNPVYVEEFNRFIDPLLLGNITLLAEEKNIVVPIAGIRGRDVVAVTPKGETTGEGTIQGRVRFERDESTSRQTIPPTVVGTSSSSGGGPPTTGGGSLPPPAAPPAAAPSSATGNAAGSSVKSADSAAESALDSGTSHAKAGGKSKQVAAKDDDKEKSTKLTQSIKMKHGVIIQVEVKPQSGG